ncbi:MAG: hypothetical protein K2J70_01190 [Muribaculaceae bacterium]|nr:hypothetical protein [Muribaculaceae bacterium]
MKALFYRAVSNKEKGRSELSTEDAINSWEIAVRNGNDYWQAKGAELVADEAARIYNFQEELKWRSMASESYKRALKMDNYLYTLIELTGTYLNLHDSVKTCAFVDSVSKIIGAYPEKTDIQISNALRAIYVYNTYCNIDKADSLYSLIENSPYSLTYDPDLPLIKANILLHRGNYSGCREILDEMEGKITDEASRNILYSLYYSYARVTGDNPLLFMAVDSLIDRQTKLILGAMKQPVTATQRDLYHAKADSEEQRSRKVTERLWWISSIAVVLILGGGALWRWHIKRKNQLIDEKIACLMTITEELEMQTELREIIDSQQAEIKERNLQIKRLNRKLSDADFSLSQLYSKQWKTINMLSKEFFDRHKRKDSVYIVANIDKELDKLKLTSFQKILEKEIDKYKNGLCEKLKTQSPFLSKEETRLCIYWFAGFSAIAISMLWDLNLSTFYAKKTRIIETINKRNPKDKELFISELN